MRVQTPVAVGYRQRALELIAKRSVNHSTAVAGDVAVGGVSNVVNASSLIA